MAFLTPALASRRAGSSTKVSAAAIKALADVDESNEKIVKWFWRMVREFSDQERALLLKFWTGRNRLVLN